MKVINNGYPQRDIIKKKRNHNKFVFGMLARWDPQKDYNNFLEAIHYLVNLEEFKNFQKKVEIKFLLAGHKIDNNNSKIKELIDKLNIGKHVDLLGDFKKMRLIYFIILLICMFCQVEVKVFQTLLLNL